MWQDRYEKSSPKAVSDGLKPKNAHGAIGEKWWSKRWLAVLDSFDLGTRLTRGRSYARSGQVMNIDIVIGTVRAAVQGSAPRPYRVKIDLKPLNNEAWDTVINHMARQAVFAAKLLAGEMPQTIEEAFTSARVSLFPNSADDFVTNCSCPDWSNPCKHVAAVYYILADQFDRDPFLLFELRGRSKDEIIEALRQQRGRGAATPAPLVEQALHLIDSVPALEDKLANFWDLGQPLDAFKVHIAPPDTPMVMLHRLGPAPTDAGGGMLDMALARMYRALR